jgi:tetraacyldisaccharide 4'-kinase
LKLNQESYRKLISGQTSGPAATFARLFLTIASLVYSAFIALRNFLYSKGWLKVHTANATVISVGNITVGGTGKTPLVIWICRFLQSKNIPCAILTRGYKTHTKKRATSDERQAMNDELAILAESCPHTRIIANPDRVAAAAEAIEKFDAKVLIMDDGFQHRRLARDLDIVAIDAMCPLGYDKLLPAGLLREPLTALNRADAVVITRCNHVAEPELTRLEEKLKSVNPSIIIARATHAPVCAKSLDHKEIPLEQLKGKRIFAFCGIGNPDAFLDTIRKLGLNLVGSKIYNDHHNYTDNNIRNIREQAGHLNADLILSTQKDRTKTALIAPAKNDIPFACLLIELKFVTKSEEDKITLLIEDALAGKIPA